MHTNILVIIRQLGLAVDESKANQEGWLTIKAPHRNDDTNPSFSLNIQHGGWKDNATQESGDIYALVQLLNPGMTFPEAKAFVDGKGSSKAVKLQKPQYDTGYTHTFWTEAQKQVLKEAHDRLKRSENSQVLNDVYSYD